MSTLKVLARACGQEQVSAGTDKDAVDGVRPSYVATPRDADAVAAVMAVADDENLRVVARGAGSKLSWGNPPTNVDLVLDLSGLDAVLEHAAGDLIVRVQPGVRLAQLQDALAPAGQRLAIDEVVPGSTVGGIIATGLSGPSRLLHGAVRDLLIGVSVVRANGVAARSGGRVVKNVAGYDLCKIYTGSYGTLGIITEAIFRLHPIPAATAYIAVSAPDEETAGAKVAAVLASQVTPTAIEVDRPRPDSQMTVCVLVEGFGPGVTARAARVEALLGTDAVVSTHRPPWWGLLPTAATTIRMTCQPSGVTAVARAVARGGAAVHASVRGSAGTGVLYAGIAAEADPAEVARLLAEVRGVCAAEGGSAVLLDAPAPVKALVDVWGPIPAITLMRKVKQSFDPQRRLSPGRFVGGI